MHTYLLYMCHTYEHMYIYVGERLLVVGKNSVSINKYCQLLNKKNQAFIYNTFSIKSEFQVHKKKFIKGKFLVIEKLLLINEERRIS